MKNDFEKVISLFTCCPDISDALFVGAEGRWIEIADVCRCEEDGQLGGIVRDGDPWAAAMLEFILGCIVRAGFPCQIWPALFSGLCTMLDDDILWGDCNRICDLFWNLWFTFRYF